MCDQVDALHKDPDIDVDGFAGIELEPIFTASRCELLGGDGSVVGLVVVVRETQIDDTPVGADIGGSVTPVVMTVSDADIRIAHGLRRTIADDEQVANAKGVASGVPVIVFACRVGLRLRGKGKQ